MRKITLLAYGRLKEPYLRAASAEYEKRLSRYCRLEIEELAPERLPDRPGEAQIAAALETEGERLLRRLPAQAETVALCIEGEPLTSEAFSRLLNGPTGHTVFLIGSSCGLSDAVKRAADRRISLSPMTFPHQLARVMLLEQIYRGFQIETGGAYHK